MMDFARRLAFACVVLACGLCTTSAGALPLVTWKSASLANVGGVPGNASSFATTALSDCELLEGGDGTPDDWGAKLRLLYFGIEDESFDVTETPLEPVAADCDSALRHALATSCELYHLYRRDDSSLTAGEFKQQLKVPAQQPYCNHPTALAPGDGLNDKADLDPIRIPCVHGEDVCRCDGTLGLVLPIQLPESAQSLPIGLLYPDTPCQAGSIRVISSTSGYEPNTSGVPMTPNPQFGAFCSDGARRYVNGCVFPVSSSAFGSTAMCMFANQQHAEAGSPLQAALRAAGNPACPTPGQLNDDRAFNLDIRVAAGLLGAHANGAILGTAGGVDWHGRAFYRIHSQKGATSVSEGPDCQQLDSTSQIECLVSRDASAGLNSVGVASSEGWCTALSPDDGDACTLDRCDPILGPVHVPCSPIDPSVTTTVKASSEWLYTGENPAQTGVDPQTIETRRATLVRGKVRSREGLPLQDVRITVVARTEFGETTTHSDGTFDMVVNGGGQLELRFEKPGYIGSGRTIQPQWNATLDLPEIVMVPPDPVVTTVTLDGSTPDFIVARGSITNDEDGARQATVLFPPGVAAMIHHADGSSELLPQMNVRTTELTVGADGPAAMPASLPYNTGYTYAFEINADEAVNADAPEIEFSEPLIYYVENFLGFPAGTLVPVGSYNDEVGRWIPHPNGIVLDIVGVTGTLADIDITGDGSAENETQLLAVGIEAGERERLAELYGGGYSLWRARLPHFTQPYDFNWPIDPPPDTPDPPPDPPEPPEPLDEPCQQQHASTLDCQNQIYRESVPVAGTELSLNYSSDRVLDYTVTNKLLIPFGFAEGMNPPSRIDIDAEVAGRRFVVDLPESGGTALFEWDGMDAYGRRLIGRQRARVSVSYRFFASYIGIPPSGRFGSPGAGLAGVIPARELAHSIRNFEVLIGGAVAHGALGAWTLDVHHHYSPSTRQLQLGDGTIQNAEGGALTIQNVAGEFGSTLGDGGDARRALVTQPNAVAVGPDGSVYIAAASRIRRVSPNGVISTYAGNGTSGSPLGDGGPATAARINVAENGLAVAGDGTLYFASTTYNVVRRVGTDGIITRVAGTGANTHSGDGGPAVNAGLQIPLDVEVGPDGSLYIAESRRIRRVSPDGTISTIAGNGLAEGTTGMADGLVALNAPLQPTAVQFDGSGRMYVLHRNNISTGPGDRVYQLEASGNLKRLAGCRTAGCPNSIDIPAANHRFRINDAGFVVTPSGQIYLADEISNGGNANYEILLVDAEGYIRQPFSKANSTYRSGELATRISFEPLALAFSQGELLVAEVLRNRVTRITHKLPALGTAETRIASDDGTEVFVFSSAGLHLRTLDALTSATKWTFGYDSESRLTSLQDAVGNVTQVERDAAGTATAIVSPYGQRTELTVGTDGFLEEIRDEQGGTHAMEYTSGGLLTTLTNPEQGVSTITYDAEGRVTSDVDAADAPITLEREGDHFNWTVTKTTAMDRTTIYETGSLADGSRFLSNTFPDGTVATETRTSNEQRITTLPDGTQVTTTYNVDPRWGSQSPIVSTSTRLPSGLTKVETQARAAELQDPLNPFSLIAQTDTSQVNGKTTTTTYTANTRTFLTTTPQGRTHTRVIDALGRTASTQTAGLTAIGYAYDAQGRLQSLTQGARNTVYTYAASGPGEGMLASIQDPMSQVTSFSRDIFGRVLSETRSGASTAFTWDGMGNLTSVAPPSQPVHNMTYTPVNLLEEYEPPAAGLPQPSTTYTYNLDRQLTNTLRPDGLAITRAYNSGGKLESQTLPGGLIEHGYIPSGSGQGRQGDLLGPYGVDLSFDYDGSLMTSMTWSGDVTGAVDWTYNNDFVPTLEAVTGASGASAASFGYDQDLLTTCGSPTTCPSGTGALTLTRSTNNGLITQSDVGGLRETLTYNTFGELATQVSTYSGAPLLSVTYHAASFPRDNNGRVVRKVETLNGTTYTWDYQYDAHDRLSDVSLDGNPVESFDYDGNGNRTGYWSPSTGNVTATYDDQDRMLSYGDWQYDYGANGELRSKLHVPSGDETVYTYNVLGNLLSVSLPSGSLIEYLVDGMGRRVGKKVDGVLVKQWLYRDSLKPAAELDGAGVLQKQFVYVAGKTAPDLVIAGGVTYRVLSDQLGSPRLVVNASDGSVVARMRHDAFGNVLEDTNPGFVPFGFAGGLYDADTGLVRFGARDYDSVTGRWTAKDPVRFAGDGANVYCYVRGDAINHVDVTGLQLTIPLPVPFPLLPGIAVCAGAAALMCALNDDCQDAFNDLLAPDTDPSIDNWYNKGERDSLDHIAGQLGLPYDKLSKELHKIKKNAGIGGRPVIVDEHTGDVTDPVSGDHIGNVLDGD